MISAQAKNSHHAAHQQTHIDYRMPIDYLLSKIKHCIDNRQKYTDAMAHAEGRDVIKYMLTLNTIECQGYVAEIQLQAHRSFMHSFAAGVVGLILIGFCVATYFLKLWSHMGIDAGAIDVTVITGIAGILTQFIAAIFLHMYNQSLRRMDTFHEHLRQVQREVMSIFIGGLVEDSALRDTVVLEEIKHLCELSRLDSITQSAQCSAPNSAASMAPPVNGPVA